MRRGFLWRGWCGQPTAAVSCAVVAGCGFCRMRRGFLWWGWCGQPAAEPRLRIFIRGCPTRVMPAGRAVPTIAGGSVLCAMLCYAVLCCAAVWCGAVRGGVVRCGVVWCGVEWSGVLRGGECVCVRCPLCPRYLRGRVATMRVPFAYSGSIWTSPCRWATIRRQR